MSHLIKLSLSLFLAAYFSGCESSSSVSATAPESETEDSVAVIEEEAGSVDLESEQLIAATMEDPSPEKYLSPERKEEAEKKYRLATQLLEFAGPIDDRSTESRNVRWLATDLLDTAITLNPSEFKYYRDLFMTYMVLQEPIRAIEVIETASHDPVLEKEVIEFQSLVFGALEFASLIKEDS